MTEALLYFIGRTSPSPRGETRYLAVRGAHVIHMLRDMREDTETGYFNLPVEYLRAHSLSCLDFDHSAYRKWVYSRVKLACQYFRAGREYISRVKNIRCRLAGYAYLARFEWMACAIERDGYRLRPAYPERKSLRAGLWMIWRLLVSLSGWSRLSIDPMDLPVQPVQAEE